MSPETLHRLKTHQLQGSTQLTLSANLTEFPPEILDLADSLEILDLSRNQLHSLPNDFDRLHRLKILFLSQNHFTTLPPILAHCPNLTMVGFKANQIHTVPAQAFPPLLRWLILTDNQIETLPPTLGQLPHLQKLMLAGNRLKTLPDSLAACQNLELIRLSANQLEALPAWLLELPKLAWLAYGGNPFCQAAASAAAPTTAPLPSIAWTDLQIAETLGEGASGIISRCLWKRLDGTSQAVAIKLFKGAITSDGLPDDEMRACVAAGQQANLVGVLGQVTNHPEGRSALILPLLDPSYRILGNPPSYATCTRDCYDPDQQFALPIAHRIAQGIAAATAHLHRQGILHGDLYAHNILTNLLTNPTGNAILSDFGAASFTTGLPPSQIESLERIEVRAFGCLLEELVDRLDTQEATEEATEEATTTTQALRQLQTSCLQPTVQNRPNFAQICADLNQ